MKCSSYTQTRNHSSRTPYSWCHAMEVQNLKLLERRLSSRLHIFHLVSHTQQLDVCLCHGNTSNVHGHAVALTVTMMPPSKHRCKHIYTGIATIEAICCKQITLVFQFQYTYIDNYLPNVHCACRWNQHHRFTHRIYINYEVVLIRVDKVE